MRSPRICVAGIELESSTHLRPVTGPEKPLTRALLTEARGPFEVGALVELGDLDPQPSPPETEDHLFVPEDAERVRTLPDDEYLELIDRMCHESLEEAFGSALQRHGWKYAVDAHLGERSLACVRAQHAPSLEVDDRYGKLQLRFNDPEKPAYLTVTDLRFVEPDHQTLREDLIDDVQSRLLRGTPVRIMFGLARAFTAAGDDTQRHWLQVNGLCLEDRPVGLAG
jgi:hypothetical protein